MKRVLGLDVSSSAIGIAIVDYNPTNNDLPILVHSSHYNPLSREENIFKRLEAVQVKIQSILDEYKPDAVAIEDVISFLGGGSTANTIITLAVFNRTVGMVCYNYLGRPPEMFSVMKIRHGLKVNKTLPKKEEIPDLVAQKLGVPWNWIMSTPRSKKKMPKPIVENFDRADACAVGIFYATVFDRPPVPKVKKTKKVKQ